MRDENQLRERYDFSLDGRQIAGFTAAALVVLGVVFVVGVVTGKRLAGEGGQPLDATGNALAVAEARTRALENVRKDAELSFQDDLTRRLPAIAVPTVSADAGRAPATEASASARDGGRPAAGVVAKATAGKDAGTTLAAGDAPAKAEPGALEKEQPAAGMETGLGGAVHTRPVEARPSAQVAEPAAPAEVSAGGAFTLQLAAYQDKGEADRYLASLKSRGYAPYLVRAEVSGKGTWYRIRMGRFPTREAAGRYLTDFRRETKLEGIIASATP